MLIEMAIYSQGAEIQKKTRTTLGGMHNNSSSPRARRVLFMGLGPNITSFVFIEKMSQESKSETLTNPTGAVLF